MQEYVLRFTPGDLAILDRALQEVAYRLAAPMIGKINAQIAEQEAEQPPSPQERKQ